MNKYKAFIQKANIKHNNKYDYSKVNFIRSMDKVVIICKEHGEFNQTPSKHLFGQGCPECGKSKIKNAQSDTKESFTNKANLIHFNFYTYEKVNYIDSKTKVVITCQIHGDFTQRPSGHLQGKGCPKCRYIKVAKSHTKTFEEFVNFAKIFHNNKYNYSKTKYISTLNKVTITCPIHGDFEQTPQDHLRSKGCSKCSNMYSMTTEEFIKKSSEMYNNKYDYTKSNYKNAHTETSIICPIHGEFRQSPHNHWKSSTGCPNCSLNGFKTNKPAILYYLKITTDDGKVLYKIGITNRSVKERFNLTDLSKIEIIKQKEFSIGQEAYNKEQEILKKYSKYKYNGPPVIECGNTELFTTDITLIDC